MLFKKKKKEETPEMSWYDVSLGQFQKLKGLDMKDFADQIEAASIILGIKEEDMSWKEFCLEVRKLDFLKDPIPKTIIRKTYTLNDTVYDCLYDLQDMSVSRYMDFINLSKTDDMVKILGVFLVPQGQEYGKYDIEKVYDDIRTLNVVEAYGIFNFFLLEFQVCIRTIKDYSVKALKQNPELQEKVSEVMESFCMSDL